MKKIILICGALFLLCIIIGCSNYSKVNYRDMPIDSIFKIIDNIDTHKLNNTQIFKRHKVGNLYLLGKAGNSDFGYDKYYIYVKKHSILEFDSLKSNNYFTQQKIESIMGEYLTFEFPRIVVDSLENIYVNPYEFESIVFIKKVSNQLVFYQDYALFYKNDWYVLDKEILLQMENKNNKFGEYRGEEIRIR